MPGSSRPVSTPNQEQPTQTKQFQTNQEQTNQEQTNHAFDFIEPSWVQSGSGGPLPEFGFGSLSGPRSSNFTPNFTPAGQVDEAHGEDWSSTAQFDFEPDRLDHSLQDNTVHQQPLGIAEASDTIITQSANTLECKECFEVFSKRHLLKYNSRLCIISVTNKLTAST